MIKNTNSLKLLVLMRPIKQYIAAKECKTINNFFNRLKTK